uniref:Uncharacterized protein n=1 Tax=Rhizophora mucronata TaxID=61149 RepID=A0A2P2PX54_RHIMU
MLRKSKQDKYRSRN